MSAHGITSTIVYFWLFKSGYAKFMLPIFVIDMIIWGPYYSNGFLAGAVFGLAL